MGTTSGRTESGSVRAFRSLVALIPVSAVSSPIAVTVASVLTDSEESGCTVGEEKSGRRIGRLRTLTFLGSLTFGFGGVGIGGKSEEGVGCD